MKSDQKTVRKRVEEILDLKLLGRAPSNISRHAEDQGWGVSERQVQRYSALADEMLAAAVERNRDKLMSYHYTARRALYARCMSVSDYGTRAIRVLRDEAELCGLYPSRGAEIRRRSLWPMNPQLPPGRLLARNSSPP